MNLSLLVKWLWRWYIVIPALVLPVAVGVGAWSLTGPTFERTATLLLVPGFGTVPDEGGNPYFYLSGLTQAADVVVRAVGAENVRRDVEATFPDAQVEVSRDPTTAGPVIMIVADSSNDDQTAAVLSWMVDRTKSDLLNLQVADRASRSDQIQVRPITIDDHSTVRHRTQLVVSVGLAGFLAVAIVFAAALINVLIHRSRARSVPARPKPDRTSLEWDDWLSPDPDDPATAAPDKVVSGVGRSESP